MELILTKDVPALGIADEVVRVKPGYARNYLLPNKLAVVATPAAVKERSGRIAKALERKKQQLAQANELAERIGRISVTFTRKSSEEGRLFGSVTKEDIANQLKEVHFIELDRRIISMETPIKTVGESVVRVRLDSGVSALLTVIVVSENHKPEVAAKVEEVVEEKAE